jgi:hypothetical protein
MTSSEMHEVVSDDYRWAEATQSDKVNKRFNRILPRDKLEFKLAFELQYPSAYLSHFAI